MPWLPIVSVRLNIQSGVTGGVSIGESVIVESFGEPSLVTVPGLGE